MGGLKMLEQVKGGVQQALRQRLALVAGEMIAAASRS
jgi:hypothetical protein